MLRGWRVKALAHPLFFSLALHFIVVLLSTWVDVYWLVLDSRLLGQQLLF